MLPSIIKGSLHKDYRGKLSYNNDFNLAQIKRMYVIENIDNTIQRGWQGHKMEQRWFAAIVGKFKIETIKIDDWDNPSKNLQPIIFTINADSLDVLHIPAGFITCIQSMETDSKLLIMSDYSMGEINDDFKYDLNYFDCIKN